MENIKKYILTCDIGTSVLRCCIYDEKIDELGTSTEKVNIITPKAGFAEIDPNDLWEKFLFTVKDVLNQTNLKPSDLTCMGLCTQRNTFLLWDKSTGIPLHNFLTWKDLRSEKLVNEWNRSWTMKFIRWGSALLYFFTRQKRFLGASIMKFQVNQANLRLKWILNNVPSVKSVLRNGNLMFGSVDTWFVYKLTNGQVHSTDASNASGTGIYDPYILNWSDNLMWLLGLPKKIFPSVRHTFGFWGETHSSIFGFPIPITAVVADQGSSLFGNGALFPDDTKITLGTGAFMNVNTGNRPIASIKGIYPVVAWQSSLETVYMAEGSASDNSVVILWGHKMKFYENLNDISEMAQSVTHPNGVFFVPSFHGLSVPINDIHATGGFLGLKEDTSPQHLVRAMMESLAFRFYQIFLCMKEEVEIKCIEIRVDGGVSQNDFLLQTISTLTAVPLNRLEDVEASSRGCCFFAGLGAGFFRNQSEVLRFLSPVAQRFEPKMEEREDLLQRMKIWEAALKRFCKWTPEQN